MDGSGLRLGENAGYRAAPTWLRLLAGLVDLAAVAGLAAIVAWAAWPGGLELPPRYWNGFDYLVDLVNDRPEVIVAPVAAFAAVYVLWSTVWGVLAGNTPAARVLGLRLCTGGGRKPGVLRVVLRAVLALGLGVAAGVGPAWALLSGRRRMLHDVLTGCHVLWGDVPEDWGRRATPSAEAGLSPGPRSYLDGPRRM